MVDDIKGGVGSTDLVVILCILSNVVHEDRESRKILKNPSLYYFVTFLSCTCPNRIPHL